MESRKYGRTFHFPFSPGTTNDDRIQYNYWSLVKQMPEIILSEKLDGENNCISQHGVFARSHAAPTVSPWTTKLRSKWALIKNDLGSLEIFGENLFAVHSIEYEQLEHHFYVFAVRYLDQWLSWDEVNFYADAFDLPTVPLLAVIQMPDEEIAFRNKVLELVQQQSAFISKDAQTMQNCNMEGIVCRNASSFSANDLSTNVFKYVRKNHVKTDEHWTKNWRKARLINGY